MSGSISSLLSTRCSPFTRAVVSSMRRLYPESLADSSWDNTGLLLETPFSSSKDRQRNSVLLTIDLTRAVADEAIARRVSVVVAYHPIIFRGLKSLTLGDSQQQSLLRLAAAGISVYSPHTAVDCAPGGLGDWLADIVTGAFDGGDGGEDHQQQQQGPESPEQPKQEHAKQLKPQRSAAAIRTYSSPTYPMPTPAVERSGSFLGEEPSTESGPGKGQGPSLGQSQSRGEKHTREPLKKAPNAPKDFEGAGMGRLVQFKQPQALGVLVDRIARGVGSPKGFPVAIPQTRSAAVEADVDEFQIRSVAICAGSGGSLFREAPPADLYFTGELSHHEALALTEQGSCVITLFHSNTERGFLPAVLRPQLLGAVAEDWQKIREEELEELEKVKAECENEAEVDEEQKQELEALGELLGDESVEIEISEADRDPYGIVVLQD